jgi:hypothetical protein
MGMEAVESLRGEADRAGEAVKSGDQGRDTSGELDPALLAGDPYEELAVVGGV